MISIASLMCAFLCLAALSITSAIKRAGERIEKAIKSLGDIPEDE